MKNRLIFLTWLLALIFQVPGFSQQAPNYELPNSISSFIPQAPTARELGEFGSTPTNLYSGMPQINIPLLSVEALNLDLPFSMSYHASGVKVDELSSWVGNGWSLSAGGVITREVRDMPDDAYYSYGNLYCMDDCSVCHNCGQCELTPNAPGCLDCGGIDCFKYVPKTFTEVGYLYHSDTVDMLYDVADYNNYTAEEKLWLFGDYRNLVYREFVFDPWADADALGGILLDWGIMPPPNNALNWSYVLVPITRSKDTEPDIFNFNFNGYSGQFVFNSSGVPKIIADSDIKIEYNLSSDPAVPANDYSEFNLSSTYGGAILDFTITTPDGVRYIFADRELSIGDSRGQGQSASSSLFNECSPYLKNPYEVDFNEVPATFTSWYLTEIITPEGGTEARFTYDKQILMDHNSLSQSMTSTCDEQQNIDEHYSHSSVVNTILGKRLKQIEFGWLDQNETFGTVDFEVETTERKDLFFPASLTIPPSYAKARNLKRIIWRSSVGNKIKQFDFSYKMFGKTNVGNCSFGAGTWQGAHRERTKLYRMTERGWNKDNELASNNPYQFTYDGTPLPPRHTLQKDYWGYYNGNNASSMIPKLYAYPDEVDPSNANYQRYQTIYSAYQRYNFQGNQVLINGSGADRRPNANYASAGILTKIKYPTGGTTIFSYELNKFLTDNLVESPNSGGNKLIEGGGLRVASIADSEGTARVFEYEETFGNFTLGHGRLMEMPHFARAMANPPNSSCVGNNPSGVQVLTNISSGSLRNLSTTHGGFVGYGKVVERLAGNGRTENFYNATAHFETITADCDGNECIYEQPVVPLNDSPLYPDNSPFAPRPNYDWNRGLLMEQRFFKEDDTEVKRIVNTYEVFGYEKIKAIKVSENRSLNFYNDTYAKYYVLTGDKRLVGTVETDFFENGNLEKNTSYGFGAFHRKPTSVSLYNGSASQSTTTKYPQDITAADGMDMGIVNGLIGQNKLDIALIETTSGAVTSGTKTEYGNFGGDLLPKRFYSLNMDGTWELEGTIEQYNYEGFPSVFQKNHYIHPVELDWLNGSLQSKTYKGWTWDYEYDFHTRKIASITSMDGQVNHFEYDGLIRLKETMGRDGNVTITNAYTQGGPSNNFVETVESYSDAADQTSRKFYDGLGRYTKTVGVGYTYSGSDAVTHQISYDGLGRKSSEKTLGSGAVSYVYEPSPLNRVIVEANGTGQIETTYKTNDVVINGFPIGSLNRMDIKDENGNDMTVYTDILDREVLKRGYLLNMNAPSLFVDTYTSYDGFGNVASVVSPDNGSFSYGYDNKNRLISKGTPGGEPTTFTYNDRNLVETTTNGNGEVLYTEYDDYDRPLEIRLDGPGGELITKNYYDGQGQISFGKLTRQDVMVMETGEMLTTIYGLDSYGRVVGTTADNQVSSGSDITTLSMDFADNITGTLREHTGDESVSINQINSFDHSFRLETIQHQIDNGPVVTIKNQGYTSEDQVSYKRLYNEAGNMVQAIGYGYNSRGWLTRINSINEDYVWQIPVCSVIQEPACLNTCDYRVNFQLIGDVSIVDLIVNDQSVPLNYPYTISNMTQFEIDLENWMANNNYAYQSILLLPNGEDGWTLTITETLVNFNSIVIFNSPPQSFYRHNCKERTEDTFDADICTLCESAGYSCDRCPYWELQDPCETCTDLEIRDCTLCEETPDPCNQCTRLGYEDCNSCPLTIEMVRSEKFTIEFNQQALREGRTSLLRITENSAYYLHEGIAEERAYTRMAVAGSGEISTGELTHRVEVPISAWVTRNSMEQVVAQLHEQVSREMTIVGITAAEQQEEVAQAVTALALENWSGSITRDDLPFSPDNPDLFSEEIIYNQGSAYVTTTPQYNGNIAGLVWQVAGRKYQSYALYYDKINRLTRGAFREQDDDTGLNNYGVNFVYDKAGNITKINRRGVYQLCEGPSYFYDEIDNLDFTYTDHRLASIEESSHKEYGYRGEGGGYTYDDGGNLIYDGNKKMNVTYNHMNLPNQFYFIETPGQIQVAYDARGSKRTKTIQGTNPDGTAVSYIKEYVDGIEYKDGLIESISHDEGRVAKLNGEWVYEYYLKDHLGNVRVVFSDLDNDGKVEVSTIYPDIPAAENELLQENHNYPYGMVMDGPWQDIEHNPENNYKFNGKELTDELGLDWLDYGARWHDPAIGRFHSIDRYADKYTDLTPFQYGGLNPALFIDVNGDSLIQVTIDDKSGYLHGKTTLYIDHTIKDDVQKVLDFAAETKTHVHINSTFRTNKNQGTLTEKNSTTPAKAGTSAHNAGLAIDFNLYKDNDTKKGLDKGNKNVTKSNKWIKKVKSLTGWRWGGDFKNPDKIHIDKKETSTFSTIRDANQKQVSGSTKKDIDTSKIKRKETITVKKKEEEKKKKK